MITTATIIAAVLFVLAAALHIFHIEVPVDVHFVADMIADHVHAHHLAHQH